jgi:hypothetical protein
VLPDRSDLPKSVAPRRLLCWRLRYQPVGCGRLGSIHPSVAQALSQKKLRLHGWVFDIESGETDALDQDFIRQFQQTAEQRLDPLDGAAQQSCAALPGW